MKNQFSRRDFLKMAATSTAAFALGPAVKAALAAPARQEAVTITMVESWFGVPQNQDVLAPVMEAISAKMQAEGLNIRVQSMVLDDHRAKYALLYSSGADFTMAFDAPWYQMNSLRDQDALVELETLMDQYGTNLQAEITPKIYDANFEFGHLYGIPAAYYYRSITGAVIRDDLRQQYGVEAPTSAGGYASLEPFLLAIKENNPELIPYANSARQTMLRPLLTMPRHQPTTGVSNSGLINPDFSAGNEFVNYEDVPAVQAAAALQRRWFEQGLLNQTDLPSVQAAENLVNDYFMTNQTAATANNDPNIQWFDYQKLLDASVPGAQVMGYELAGLMDRSVRPMGVLKQFNFVVFNGAAPVEQQQAGVQFFDWLTTSQDNMDLWLMGIDGVNYVKGDGLSFTEVDGVDASRNYRRQWYVSGLSGRFQRQPADWPDSVREAIAFVTTEENWDFYEYEGFAPDLAPLEQWTTQLNAVYDEAFHGLATGQLPVEEATAQMKSLLDSAGRQELRDALNTQLQAYIAEMG